MDSNVSENNLYAPQDLRNLLRLLWSQYVMWTRFLIVSMTANLGDIPVVTNRLFQIPKDFAELFLIYYGKEQSEQFDTLFRENIRLTIALTDAIINNKTSDLPQTQKSWEENATQLSILLSNMNPYWDKNIFETLFYHLLDMTMDEIFKRKNKQYALDVYQYEFIEYYALMIADIMWNGFMNRFYEQVL